MANVFKDNNLSFHYNKNLDNSINIPNIYILNRRLKKIGQIEDITELEIIVSFNEPNEISFTTHKNINGRKTSLWKYIKENALINVEGFGIFEIEAPVTDADAIIKQVHGQDFCSIELGQINCTLEINTENDYSSTVTPLLSDVKPTLFYDETDTEHSLLHRILSYAPHYSVDHIDDSLCGMNRELSCSDSSIYDFLTGDVSKEFGCIFIFNKFKRSISAYDLKDHCMTCGSHHIIGTECQDCKLKGRPTNNIEQGYGYNSSVYVDTENLATEMTLTSNKDNIKNCFKLEAGDDTMTEMIGQRLIGGTNYIWTFSNEMLNDMSDELREKYTAYTKLVESYQSEFNSLWNNFNEYTNKISYYKDNMFPEVTSNITSASQALNVIQSTITYACIANKTTVLSTVSKSILNYAKLLLPDDYGIRFEKDANGDNMTSCTTTKDGNYNVISTWTGNLYVYKYNYTDDKGNDLDYIKSGTWTLPVKKGYNDTLDNNNNYSNEYYLYLKMQLDAALAKSKVSGVIKHDSDYKDNISNHLNDADYYKNFFNKLNLTSLQSYYDAYNTASVIINQLNPNISTATYIRSDGTISDVDILNALLKKYRDFSSYINSVIAERQKTISNYETKLSATQQKITAINNLCDLKSYLGEELYFELLSFKREDTYKNDNFTSDMSDNDTDLLADIDEFILDAKEEIAKACQLQYSCTVTLGNLLLDKNFNYDKIYEKFVLGNFIRLSIDDNPVKIRIIQITFKFDDDIENLPITLSDALVGDSVINDYQNVINNAKSIASSFQFVTKQTDKNNKNLTSVVGKLRNEGLAAVNDMLNKAENISLTIDNQGLLGRKWNEDLNQYEDKQLRIINNVIGFTDNNWETVKTALGNIYYNGSWRYGLLADVIVGNVIAGENLTISDKGNKVVINGDGITLDGGAITWKSEINQSAVSGLEEDLEDITNTITENHKTVEDFINKDYATYITETKKQLDKKSETWYQIDNPASTWTTDDLKNKHVGDLWYDLSSDANGNYHTYVYNSSYHWVELNGVPQNVFDMADGKASIYISKPTKYKAKDLWILDVENSNGNNTSYPCFAKGTLLTAIKSSNNFSVDDWDEKVKYSNSLLTLHEELQDYIDNIKEDLQGQIDGEIDSWFYDYNPTLTNEPASKWATEEAQIKHEGDLFYNVSTGIAYRFIYDNTDKKHKWTAITDAAITKALELISHAQSTADNKCQTFYSQPNAYDDGDLWILSSETTINNVKYSANTILIAVLPNNIASRNKFVSSDWLQITTKSAEKALSDLSDIASDGKITPVEKQQLKLTMSDIYADKKSIDLQCNSYSITESNSIYKAYITAYNNLVAMTNNLLSSMSTTSSTPSNFNSLFNIYYNALADMSNVIETATKKFTSDSVKSLQNDLKEQIDGKIETFYQSTIPSWNSNENSKHVGDLWYNTSKNNIVFDNIIYKAETNYRFNGSNWEVNGIVPKDVYDTIDSIASIYATIPLNPQENDILIPNSNFSVNNTTYYSGKVYKYQKVNGKFIWQEIKYTDDTEWKHWTSDTGDFGKYKKDIQNQIDGKSETSYGGAVPPSNPETGDLWFCTDMSKGYSKNKAYMYDGTTWKESNGVPDDVWNIADGKSSIFVLKPSKAISSIDANFYHKNDLWILESDTVLHGHTKGTIMIATSDSTTFNASHWIEKVKYTDDTKASRVNDKLNEYKTEISDFQSKVNTQLSVAGVTQIGETYVYSPKIASGYLYINKNGCSVEIDPAQTYNSSNDKIIDIKANNNDVFYVSRDGAGYFKGNITANGGRIGNWTIASNGWLCANNIIYGDDSAGISWVTIDGDDIYNFSLNGTNMEMSKNDVLVWRLNDYNKGYYFSDNNFVVNCENFKISSNGDMTVGRQINMDYWHFSSKLYDAWELDIYTRVDYPFLCMKQYSNNLSIYPSKDNTCSLGTSDHHFSSIYTSSIYTSKESHFSNGTYSDPCSGVTKAIKCSGGLAADDIITKSDIISGQEIYINGNKINMGNWHFSSKLYDAWELDIYTRVDYPFLCMKQYSNNLSIYPSSDNQNVIGTSSQKFQAMNAYAFNTSSDRKLKKNIKKIDDDWADKFIDSLIASSYQFKDNMYGKTHTGFIAQEVEKSILSLGMKLTDFAGLVKTPKNTDNPDNIVDPDNFEGADENYDYSLRYDDFIAPLVAYCQNLKKKNTELENKLNKIYEKLGLLD